MFASGVGTTDANSAVSNGTEVKTAKTALDIYMHHARLTRSANTYINYACNRPHEGGRVMLQSQSQLYQSFAEGT